MEIMTNAVYSETIKVFKTACEIADVKPTSRQVSKFQRGCGKAFAYKEMAKNKAYKK